MSGDVIFLQATRKGCLDNVKLWMAFKNLLSVESSS